MSAHGRADKGAAGEQLIQHGAEAEDI